MLCYLPVIHIVRIHCYIYLYCIHCVHELTLISQQCISNRLTRFSSLCDFVNTVYVILLTQLEFEKKAAEERVKRAEMYDSTLEERAREQATQLAEARDKESQHRATAAQMRFVLY